MNAQQHNLIVNHNNVQKDILNVGDIGKCFQQDSVMSNCAKINYVMNGFFF